ncbi:MAG: efflux RND transporter periplasmic adaptor subunit [Lentisphaeraceae bacterium]|nr:efflux RND transporter periplasmic adaptor subunit [Lentisphaeraceae bacterium]
MKIFYFLSFIMTITIYAETYEGVTEPSADVSASFTVQSLVKSVLVKEGDFVKGDQLLAVQNREVQEQELKRLRKELDGDIASEKARIEINYYKKDLINLGEAFKKGATSQKELNDVELALRTAELSLKEATLNDQLTALKIKELESSLKDYELRTPVDGIIEKLSIDSGESPRPGEEHIRIVSIDPMWVEIPTPRNIAMKLKKGGKASVLFPEVKASQFAEIIFISPVVDTASDTVRVKVQLPNPKKRLVGERVQVDFSIK